MCISDKSYNHTPYSKMAATKDGLGRVARKRGIEGHGTHSMRHRDVGIKFDLETFFAKIIHSSMLLENLHWC